MRIWNWYDPVTHRPMWGTYGDYRMMGGLNGEAVTEPVALDVSGTGVNPYMTMDGRLQMTYRHGALYEPISFQELNFPSALPMKWAYGN